MKILFLILPVWAAFGADQPIGAKLFQQYCAACHDNGNPADRIPPTQALRKLTPGAIMKALETGVMRTQGARLSRSETRALAGYLGTPAIMEKSANELANRCPADPGWPASKDDHTDWAGWGGGLSNWRFQSPEAAGLRASDIPNLKLRWAFAFPDATSVRSQPAVFRGRIFIGSHDGAIYSLNAATGCTYWATTVFSQVRSGLSIGVVNGRPLAFAGDVTGTVYGLDAATGKVLWNRRLEDHSATMATATPVLYENRLFVGASSYEETLSIAADYVCCTFRGSVQALRPDDGALVWKTYTVAEAAVARGKTKRGRSAFGPSGAGVWSAPTIDPARKLLYVTTGDNYSDPPTKTSDAVLAMSLADGRIVWAKQLLEGDAYNSSCGRPGQTNCPDSEGPDYDLGASAILVSLGQNRRALLLGQKSGIMHAVNPDEEGEFLWHARVGSGGALGGIQWGPATDGKLVYVAVSDIRTRRNVDAAGKATIEPDPEKGGGLFALRIDNGERVWQTPNPGCGERRPCSPAQSAAVTAMDGVVFSGSVDGHLRGYDTASGKIVWDYDTAREHKTVNGVPGRGGAMDAGGPVIAGGMLFVGAGYGQWGGLPGNVLLAFGVEK